MAKNMSAQQILMENCLRLRGDLTQGEVATRATRAGFKIDQKAVSRMEDPESSNATVQKIEAVAAGLGVPPWKLLLPSNVSQLPITTDPRIAKILDLSCKLNEDGITALLFSVEVLTSDDKYLTKPKSKQQK